MRVSGDQRQESGQIPVRREDVFSEQTDWSPDQDSIMIPEFAGLM